ncbi:TonB-dependent receptor [uncultured Bacteroides sp.]|uniref:SusC/RagA family TonB-linked outer membrane protein n=1 Tax=uncultured Bacteroides sp. TaxID=162156 RepID=UPI002AAB0A15|nr:TonB-dependent receptor [uncultured Bacteroides sp.]
MKRKNVLKKGSFLLESCSLRKTWFAYGLSFGLAALPLSGRAEVTAQRQGVSIEQSVNQSRKISGHIADQNGETLIGVSVAQKGTSNGVITDLDGNFTLNVPVNAVLTVSYVGYKPQEIKVGNQQKLSIKLEADNKLLDEVVVVGYGVVKKADLTGSVGSVKSENISAKGATSLMESLQGQVAGVNISQSSSRAGDGFSIQIRGKSSLNGGDPLYVIDGVVCDNMNFLNPMDIEKVDILKDASSTAIYGSRATNGVVMITTKKGDTNTTKATVSYDGYYGVKTKANMPDFMNGDQFMNFRFSRYLTSALDNATGLTTWDMSASNLANFWGGDSQVVKDMYLNKKYTNWFDQVTRDGSQQNHFLNISGNAKDITYHVGLGYQNEKGILYDAYERWNLKGALEHKISDKLLVGFSTNLATSMKNNGSQNSVLSGFRMTPNMPCYYWEGDNAGQLIYQPGKDAVVYPNGGGPTSNINPVIDRNNSKDDTRYYDMMANMYLQYSPVKDLIFKTTFSPMYSKNTRGTFYGTSTQLRQGKTNMAEKYNNDVFSYTWDTQANYMKTIGDHSFNALALFSVYQQKAEGDYINVVDMPFDVDWYNLGSGTVQDKWSYYNKISMLSYVGRINYAYKGRYMVTVSSRWDGSSKFQQNNRWGMFPSAALAWRISDEKFMESAGKWLSNLKIRASFGITGNNAGVGPYDTQALANVKNYYNFGSNVANGYGYTMTNANLTWEKTTEFNFGFDFGLLKNRINGSVDIYNKDSKDLLMKMDTPYELGSNTGSIVNNVGKVNNKGIEVQLNTLNVQTKSWRWETNFSFARNINKIEELNDAKEDLVGNSWFIGHPIDVVYGYKYTGICTREEAQAYAKDVNMKTKFFEGEMKIFDKDGNGTINADDKMIIGHCAPTWTGSIASNLSYKNLDFSISIYASQGGKVYSSFMNEFLDYGQRGMMRMNMDFYIPEGAPILGEDGKIAYQDKTHYGKYPFPTNGTNGKGGGAYWSGGSQNFVDNSFVKVKNITVGYTFPKKWMSKIHVSNLRIYANILNPFVFTNYEGFDPEWASANIGDGTNGVSSRTYQFGVNLKF